MSELERWETRFRTPDYVFGEQPNAFLKSKAHLLSELTQFRLLLVHSGSMLLLVRAAIVPPSQVNELADCCGEILAEFIERRVPAHGELVPFLPTLD